MIVAETVPFLSFRLFLWQKVSVLWFAVAAFGVTAADHFLDVDFLHLSSTPLTVIGAALAIFVGFRTNSAYDRWWEGRKLWGRMVNASRLWAVQTMNYVDDSDDETRATMRQMVRSHAAYVHTLRCALRTEDPLTDEHVTRLIDDGDKEALQDTTNHCVALLHRQGARLRKLLADNKIDGLKLQSFDATITELLGVQGGCERIKKTPIPRIYGGVATMLVMWFSVLLPLGVVKDLGWLTPVVTLAAVFAFHLINETGRVLEDPFTTFFNGLPLSQLSLMIEANTMEQLGAPDERPEIPGPVDGFLLM